MTTPPFEQFRPGLRALEGEIVLHPDAPSGEHIAAMVMGALNTCGIGLMLLAPDDTIVFRSSTLIEMLNIPPAARTFADIVRHCHATGEGLRIEADDIESWLAGVAAKRRTARKRSFEVDLCDGRWLWIDETTFGDGWLWCVFTDITRLKTSEQIQRQAANTDPLTDLPNRRAARVRMRAAIAEAADTGTPLTIALIDLDHFKSINDRFGHETGDKVLVQFAIVACATSRRSDVVARIGGEEFLVLMPGCDLADAGRTIDALRQKMLGLSLTPEPSLHCTFSAGLAAFEGQSMEQLLNAADKALYRAKETGRDRTFVSATAPPHAA